MPSRRIGLVPTLLHGYPRPDALRPVWASDGTQSVRTAFPRRAWERGRHGKRIKWRAISNQPFSPLIRLPRRGSSCGTMGTGPWPSRRENMPTSAPTDPFAAKRAAMCEEFLDRHFLLGGWLGGTDTYKRTMWSA